MKVNATKDSKRTLLKGYISPFQDSEGINAFSIWCLKIVHPKAVPELHGCRSYVRAITEKCPLLTADHLGPCLRFIKERNSICHPLLIFGGVNIQIQFVCVRVLFPELSRVVTPARSNEDSDFSKIVV